MQLVDLELVDMNDAPMAELSQHPLPQDRRAFMATAFPELAQANAVAIIGKSDDGSIREFVAIEEGGKPKLVMGSCQITFADITPSECIEYAFEEQPGQWRVAQLSLEALETYRGTKFKDWHNMLRNPSCEAQFRRMLQIGVVTRLYDQHLFPTPDALKSLYQVTDEKSGKHINLPHPVAELRVWDAPSQKYVNIDPQTEGAPSLAEKVRWWDNLLAEFKASHGDEYIDSLLAGK